MPQGTVTGSVPLSKSQRNKAKQIKLGHHGPTVSACVCSACGQHSNAQLGTTHVYCQGMPEFFFQKAPLLRGRLTGQKGTWISVADFKEAEAVVNQARKVVALFTWIASFLPKPEAKQKTGGNDQGDHSGGPIVQKAKLSHEGSRKHQPNRKVKKAA